MFDDASHTFTVVNSTARVAIVVKVPVAHSRLVSAANSFAMLLFVNLYIVDGVLVGCFNMFVYFYWGFAIHP